MLKFAPLHIRTEILELMEWDEEMTDEAIARAMEVVTGLYMQGIAPAEAPKKAEKILGEEYDKRVTKLLIEYVTVMATKIQMTGEA